LKIIVCQNQSCTNLAPTKCDQQVIMITDQKLLLATRQKDYIKTMLKKPMEKPVNGLAIVQKSALFSMDAYQHHRCSKLAHSLGPNAQKIFIRAQQTKLLNAHQINEKTMLKSASVPQSASGNAMDNSHVYQVNQRLVNGDTLFVMLASQKLPLKLQASQLLEVQPPPLLLMLPP